MINILIYYRIEVKSIELIGQSYPMENIGKVRRFGGDLSITYQDRINDFNYYVSANWSCRTK